MRAYIDSSDFERRSQGGFSLVEVMVALGLSTMLMMGVVAMFVSSRTSYESTERLSRIQENGRYALDQIASDGREAGFPGCTKPDSTNVGNFDVSTLPSATDPDNVLFNFSNAVQGYQADGAGSWTPSLTPAITNLALDPAPANVSDVVVLRMPRRGAVPLRLAVSQLDANDALNVPAVAGATVSTGDVVLISDCFARAVFAVTGYAASSMTHTMAGGSNASTDLKHRFLRGAEIVPLETAIYYLALRNGITDDATRLSLWRRSSSSGQSEELAEGIERMEVQYGIDSNADSRVDSYVTAAAVTLWANVMSVRIALLARSPEPYGTDLDKRTYVLLDQNVAAANDRHQRQVFTSTIALRNVVID